MVYDGLRFENKHFSFKQNQWGQKDISFEIHHKPYAQTSVRIFSVLYTGLSTF